MKLFLDTADVQEIRKWHGTGLIDGVTTNPSHLYRQGGQPEDAIKKICDIVHDGVVSVEITQIEPDAVYQQAKKIALLAQNIVVKVPCSRDYYPVIKRLVQEGIPLNITLVFTLIQSVLMGKLGVEYISPFVGRWEDLDVDGIVVLPEIREAFKRYGFQTQLLAASLRSVRHVHHAMLAGADVVTVPLDVMQKMTEHLLTQQGIEKFLADWKKLDVVQFP